MTTSSLAVLKSFLLSRYDDLKGQLTRRLGSADLASDALQDTWLQLQNKEEKEMELGPVRSPAAYLLRMASNLAVDQQRTTSRVVSFSEIESLLEMPAEAPGPAQIVQARSECEELVRLIEGMPARRRQILLAVRLDGTPQYEIAARLGISLRLVERELKKAHEHCATLLVKKS